MKKFNTFVICLLSMLFLTSCVFDRLGDIIASDVIGNIQDNISSNEGSKPDTSTNYPSYENSTNDSVDLPENDSSGGLSENIEGEDVIYEKVLIEDLVSEKETYEEATEEKIISELMKEENFANEKYHIRKVSVDILGPGEFDDYDFMCDKSSNFEDLDWGAIHDKLSEGISIILTEVVIDIGSLVFDLWAQQYGQVAIDGTQIVISLASAPIYAYVRQKAALAAGLAAGDTYEEAYLDSIDIASESFLKASLVVDTVNTAVSVLQGVVSLCHNIKKVANLIKGLQESAQVLGKNTKLLKNGDNLEFIDNYGNAHNAYVSDFTNGLYDAKTNELLSTVKKNKNGGLELFGRKLPKEIYNSRGKLSYTIDNGTLYKVTKNSEPIPMGKISADGVIRNFDGKITEIMDLSTGRITKGLTKLNPNVSIDLKSGNFIDVRTNDSLKVVSKNGTNYYQFVDGQDVMYEYMGKNNEVYLKSCLGNNKGKTCGILDADGKLDMGWLAKLNSIRGNVTHKARKQLIDYVDSASYSDFATNFPQLTREHYDYIKEFKKVPRSIEAHHIKNVADYPDFAGDMDNLVFCTRGEHKHLHFDNFQNSTHEKPPYYVNLEELFAYA